MTTACDVLVVGGGTAGVMAAVSAARLGADVLLVERRGFLGGTMTSSSLGSLCGYYTVVEGHAVPVVGGLPLELVARLRAMGGSPETPLHWLRTASVPYDLFTMKVLLDELVAQSGARLLLHSEVVDVGTTEGGVITTLQLRTPSGLRALRAKTVIDTTGDAEVTTLAGGTSDFDPAVLQAPTTMFRFGGVDTDVMRTVSRTALHTHLEAAVAADLDLPRTAGGMYSVRDGVVHVNITRVGGGIDPFQAEDKTAAEIEGRRQVRLYEEAFRRFVPGFERAFVLDSGVELGIRETRRIHGDQRLTECDVTTPARFDDVIACSAWPIEDHAGGRDIRWVWLDPGDYYQIPLGIMLPRALRNVVVAGRSVSSTHDAHASVRVTAQCFAMGEAAGVLAALAADAGTDLRSVPTGTVQAELLRRGVFLGERRPAAGETRLSAAGRDPGH